MNFKEELEKFGMDHTMNFLARTLVEVLGIEKVKLLVEELQILV